MTGARSPGSINRRKPANSLNLFLLLRGLFLKVNRQSHFRKSLPRTRTHSCGLSGWGKVPSTYRLGARSAAFCLSSAPVPGQESEGCGGRSRAEQRRAWPPREPHGAVYRAVPRLTGASRRTVKVTAMADPGLAMLHNSFQTHQHLVPTRAQSRVHSRPALTQAGNEDHATPHRLVATVWALELP